MRISDSLRKAASIYDAFANLLKTISELTDTTKDDEAVEALKAIRGAIHSYLTQDDIEHLTVAQIEKSVEALRAGIKTNDQSALDALHKKFDIPKDEE